MRKIILLGATLGMLATVSSASAQSSGSWIGSLGGGVTLPMGNFKDAAKMGYHGAATLGYKQAGSKMEWLVDASYHHFTDKFSDNAHQNLFVALGRVNYWVAPKVYLLAGAGMMRDEVTATILGVTAKNSTTAFAAAGGVGLALGKSLMLEGRVLNGFTKGSSTTMIPITIGIRF